MAKLYPPPPNSTPRVQDLNKLEFTLPEDAPLWHHPTPGDHNMNNLESTLPAQMMLPHELQIFWLNCFREDFQRFFLYIFLCEIFYTTLWPHPTPRGS